MNDFLTILEENIRKYLIRRLRKTIGEPHPITALEAIICGNDCGEEVMSPQHRAKRVLEAAASVIESVRGDADPQMLTVAVTEDVFAALLGRRYSAADIVAGSPWGDLLSSVCPPLITCVPYAVNVLDREAAAALLKELAEKVGNSSVDEIKKHAVASERRRIIEEVGKRLPRDTVVIMDLDDLVASLNESEVFVYNDANYLLTSLIDNLSSVLPLRFIPLTKVLASEPMVGECTEAPVTSAYTALTSMSRECGRVALLKIVDGTPVISTGSGHISLSEVEERARLLGIDARRSWCDAEKTKRLGYLIFALLP